MAREIVLLAGMHRSGTSALARVCNLLGAVLPGPLVPPSLGNELGHWEPAEVVAMNDRALLAAGGDVNGLHPLSPEWTASARADAFIEEIAAYVARAAPEGALTAIKDPRIALLAPYWRAGVERAGVTPRFVLAFRDPGEVARSLSRRQIEYFPDEVWPQARVIALWLKHQLELELATRGAARSFVGYAGVLTDWRGQTRRMFAQLGLDRSEPEEATAEAVDAFVRPDARRQRRSHEDQGPALVATVLRLLKTSEADPGVGAKAYDAARDRFEGSLDLLGGYLEALEARAPSPEPTASQAASSALRLALEAAEQRAVEAPRPPMPLGDDLSGDDPADDDPHAAAAELRTLRRRHAALKAVQRRTAEALRTGREAWRTREARLEGLLTDGEAATARFEVIETEAGDLRDELATRRRSAVELAQSATDRLQALTAELEQARARAEDLDGRLSAGENKAAFEIAAARTHAENLAAQASADAERAAAELAQARTHADDLTAQIAAAAERAAAELAQAHEAADMLTRELEQAHASADETARDFEARLERLEQRRRSAANLARKASRQGEAAAGDLERERTRARELGDRVARLAGEVTDHRDAYDALRVEAAEARAQVAETRAQASEALAQAEAAGVAETSAQRQAQAQRVTRAEAEAALQARDAAEQSARRQFEEALSAARAETDALRGSTS